MTAMNAMFYNCTAFNGIPARARTSCQHRTHAPLRTRPIVLAHTCPDLITGGPGEWETAVRLLAEKLSPEEAARKRAESEEARKRAEEEAAKGCQCTLM